MKITTVSLSRTIPTGPYMNDKIGMEATLEEGESESDALHTLSARIEKWHKENSPHLYQDDKQPFIPGTDFPPHMKTEITFGPPPVIDYGKHSQNPEDILEEIKSASSLEILKSFKVIAGSPGNEELYKAYNSRVKELMK